MQHCRGSGSELFPKGESGWKTWQAEALRRERRGRGGESTTGTRLPLTLCTGRLTPWPGGVWPGVVERVPDQGRGRGERGDEGGVEGSGRGRSQEGGGGGGW